MAARTTVGALADATIESFYQFGGTSGKKRKCVTFILHAYGSGSGTDTPWNIGSTTGDLPVAMFGFTKIEQCSALAIYTTATGVVARIYPAAPSTDGTEILLTSTAATAGATTDMALAYNESARITLIGY
jgi:hypothetical protein